MKENKIMLLIKGKLAERKLRRAKTLPKNSKKLYEAIKKARLRK